MKSPVKNGVSIRSNLATAPDWLNYLTGAPSKTIPISQDQPFFLTLNTSIERQVSCTMHAPCECEIVMSGALELLDLYQDTTITRGGFSCYNSWEPHGWRARGRRTRTLVVFFLPAVLQDWPCAPLAPYLPLICPGIRPALQPKTRKEREEIVSWAQTMWNIFTLRKPGWETLVKIELYRMLIRRMQAVSNMNGPLIKSDAMARRILPIIRHIHQSLDRKLTLAEASGLLGMNRAFFSEAFRRVMGVSFAEYVLHCRLRAAYQQLIFENGKLEAVARKIGFANSSHLSRLLKQRFGKSLLALRRDAWYR